MSATLTENFKSLFGYRSDTIVADKRARVDGVLDRLEKSMAGLRDATRTAQMTYHPGAAGNTGDYKSLRQRWADLPSKNLPPSEAYDAYDAIETQANAAHATVFALVEADKRIDDIRKMKPKDIDDMVDGFDTARMMGAPGHLNGDEERGTLIAAIKVRYGIDEMAGDLPDDVLSRFYHALSMVPANHTKDNPTLKIIKRSSMQDTSLYSADGTGTICINAGGTGDGLFNSGREIYNDGAGVTMKLNRFDAHTLHEVGHSVDDACGFMDLRGKAGGFGGWRPSSFAEAVNVGVQKIKDSYPDIPVPALSHLLTQAIARKTFDETIEAWRRELRGFSAVSRETMLSDGAVRAADDIVRETLTNNELPLSQEALTLYSDALRLGKLLPLSKLEGQQRAAVSAFLSLMKDGMKRAEQLSNHLAAAASALEDVVALRGAWDALSAWGLAITKELWWAGSTAIQNASFGGRVYQEDNGKWWSYAIGARNIMVKDYQFRSPGEWFAEVYAMEMLGKLSDGHPCKGLIRKLDTTKKLAE